MRVRQPRGTAGSLKWIQRLVTRFPQHLAAAGAIGDRSIDLTGVHWVSPREQDDWAEYRDGEFLRAVGRDGLIDPLQKFWPKRGPQWDALGIGRNREVLLVEGKAHLSELISSCAANASSRVLIDASLKQTAEQLGCSLTSSWTKGYYQYANRLAHLRFLQRHGVPAHLIFVYFYGDRQMGGPDSASAWKPALQHMYKKLGLTMEPSGVVNAFVDVGLLGDTDQEFQASRLTT